MPKPDCEPGTAQGPYHAAGESKGSPRVSIGYQNTPCTRASFLPLPAAASAAAPAAAATPWGRREGAGAAGVTPASLQPNEEHCLQQLAPPAPL